MLSPAPQNAVPPGPTICSPAEALALTQRRLDELDRLRGIGMQQAETLGRVTESLSGAPEAQYRAMVGGNGTIREFERLNRAIRQIVVLEFELRGLFKAPDRESPKLPKLGMVRFDPEKLLGDLNDYSDLDDLFDYGRDRAVEHINDLNDLRVRLDYSKDPVDRLIEDIRGILGVTAPEDDPFAPPSSRRPSAPVEPKAMSHEAAALERQAEILRRFAAMKRPPGMVPRPAAAAAAKPASAQPAPAKAAKPMPPRKGFRIPPTSSHNPGTPASAKRKRNRGPPGKRR